MPTITFNANGGTYAPSPQVVPSGTMDTLTYDEATYDINVTFDANGGTFYQGTGTRVQTFTMFTGEWATSKADADVGNIAYEGGDPILLTDDITLYAVWYGHSARLTETPIEDNSAGNIAERPDYRIDPEDLWTYTRNGNDTVSIPLVLTHDITIYAKWQYRIYFDLTGGYTTQGPPYYIASPSSGVANITITDAVEGYKLHNVVVDMNYRAAGYTSATVTIADTIDSQAYTINFGRTIYGGSINFYTGELTSAYEADGTPKDPWDTYTVTPVWIYTFENGTDTFNVSTNVGVFATLEYYTSASSSEIIPDEGPFERWKTHGVNFVSPFTNSNLYREGYTIGGFATSPSASSPSYVVNFTYSVDAPIDLYAFWAIKTWTVRFLDGYSPSGSDFLKSVVVANGSDVPVSEVPVVGNTYGGRVFKKPGNYSLLGWSGPYDYTIGTLTNITSDVNSSAIWDFAPIWIRVEENGVRKWISYKPTEGGT